MRLLFGKLKIGEIECETSVHQSASGHLLGSPVQAVVLLPACLL